MLKQDYGFSLIEVLMSSVILGVLSLFLAKIYNGSIQNAQNYKVLQDESEVLNKVNFEFSKKAVCQNNFLSSGTTPMDRGDIPHLVDSKGDIFISKGAKVGKHKLLTVSKISSSKVSDSSMELHLQLRRGNQVGVKEYQRSLRFFVESDGTNITGCFEVENSVENTITSITCLTNEGRGVYDSVKDSSGKIVRCERIGLDLTACPDDRFVNGVLAPGESSDKYTTSCAPHVNHPVGDCSGIPYGVLFFDNLGNPLCQNPSALQVFQAFNPFSKNCSNLTHYGFEINSSNNFVLDCGVGGNVPSTTLFFPSTTSTTFMNFIPTTTLAPNNLCTNGYLNMGKKGLGVKIGTFGESFSLTPKIPGGSGTAVGYRSRLYQDVFGNFEHELEAIFPSIPDLPNSLTINVTSGSLPESFTFTYSNSTIFTAGTENDSKLGQNSRLNDHVFTQNMHSSSPCVISYKKSRKYDTSACNKKGECVAVALGPNVNQSKNAPGTYYLSLKKTLEGFQCQADTTQGFQSSGIKSSNCTGPASIDTALINFSFLKKGFYKPKKYHFFLKTLPLNFNTIELKHSTK